MCKKEDRETKQREYFREWYRKNGLEYYRKYRADIRAELKEFRELKRQNVI